MTPTRPDGLGIAYVSERGDPRTLGAYSGRFDCFSEAEDARGRRESGPRNASLSEALAWARAKAPVVLLRIGDETHYSAGDVPVHDEPTLPQWTQAKEAGFLTQRAREAQAPWEARAHVLCQARGDPPARVRRLKAIVGFQEARWSLTSETNEEELRIEFRLPVARDTASALAATRELEQRVKDWDASAVFGLDYFGQVPPLR